MLDARVLPRPTGPVTGPVRTPSTWEMPIESALPFLLIGPLARTGYLDTLAAVFAAARISDALPLFAMALAYKVLAPPKRGWLREPSRALGGAIPLSLLDTADGFTGVMDELGRIEHGVFS